MTLLSNRSRHGGGGRDGEARGVPDHALLSEFVCHFNTRYSSTLKIFLRTLEELPFRLVRVKKIFKGKYFEKIQLEV